MQISDEIQEAARQLGEALRQDENVRPYLEALAGYQNDPEAKALEERVYCHYKAMIARQQSGETNREDIQRFNDLRRQAQLHPKIAHRNDMLHLIKPYLNEVAEEISFILGVDFTAPARSE